MTTQSSLFGLSNSNRDFSKTDAWGKNQFNSSFPAALSCYLDYQGIAANYILDLLGNKSQAQTRVYSFYLFSSSI